MSSLRLVMIAERFWPLPARAAVAAEQLGRALVELGVAVTYLACKWEKNWPDSFPFAGGEVQFGAPPARNWFGSVRPHRGANQVLESLRHEIDGFIVCLPADSLALYGRLAAEHDLPCLIWVTDEAGDLATTFAAISEFWSAEHAVRRCRVVCESPEFAAEWRRRCLPPTGLLEIETAIELPGPDLSWSRVAARTALANLDLRLRVGERQRVCLALGPIRQLEAWTRLVQAWPPVLQQERGVRLWLMGDGDGFARLGEIAHRMPDPPALDFLNWFDALDELFQAVDLLIVPDRAALRDRWALRAMATGLPVLAADDGGPDQSGGQAGQPATGLRDALAQQIVAALRAGRTAPQVVARQAWVRRHRDIVPTATRAESWIRELAQAQPGVRT